MEKKTIIPVGIVKVLWDYDEYESRVIDVFYVLDIVYDKKYKFCNNFYFMNGNFCTGNEKIYSSNFTFDELDRQDNQIELNICGDIVYVDNQQYQKLSNLLATFFDKIEKNN